MWTTPPPPPPWASTSGTSFLPGGPPAVVQGHAAHGLQVPPAGTVVGVASHPGGDGEEVAAEEGVAGAARHLTRPTPPHGSHHQTEHWEGEEKNDKKRT